jgi:hypothetical protein
MRRRVSRSLHSLLRFGIGGDGFLDRIRALSFAMLGLTAAAALALVFFIANQGWPQVGSLLPVPAVHRAELSENSIVALPTPGKQSTGGVTAASAATPAPVLAGGGSGERQARSPGTPKGSDAGPASNVVVLAPESPRSTTPSSSGTETKPSQPAPAPAPSEAPAATTPETTPAATPQPTATTPSTPTTAPPSTPTTTPPNPETGTPNPDEPTPDEPTPDEPSEGSESEGEPEGGEDLPSSPSEPPLPPEPESTPDSPLPDEAESDPIWPSPGDWGGFGFDHGSGFDHGRHG